MNPQRDQPERESTEDDEPIGDDATEERQLFGERRAETAAYVASEIGVTRVELAADRVGGFSLVTRCDATSIATEGGRVAIGTMESVELEDGNGFSPVDATRVGETTAVGLDSEWLYRASPTGIVERYSIDGVRGWEEVGEVTEPRRFDGSLLASRDGVYRVGNTLEKRGLSNVLDVVELENGSDSNRLFAATDAGIYRRDGSEWQQEFDRPVCILTGTTVPSGRESGKSFANLEASERPELYAIGEAGVLERRGGTWHQQTTPAAVTPVDLAFGESLYGVTRDGDLLIGVDAESTSDGWSGWRSHALGLRGVVGLVVKPAR